MGEVWSVVAFCVYTFFFTREIALKSWQRGPLFLLKKLSYLTWETTLLSHCYLIGKLFLPNSFPQHVRNKVYLICLSLNCIVVIAYWTLFSINPKLVDNDDYTGWDIEWATTLFSHGGNLVFLLGEGWLMRQSFKPPSMGWFLQVEVVFTTFYCCMQWVCRQVTGQAVYGFLDAMSMTEVCTFYTVLGLISLFIKTVASLTLTSKAKVA